jgi:hypothetical protein
MISPFTPPGTKIVCIDAAPSHRYIIRGAGPISPDLDGLRQWEIYTVAEIVEDRQVKAGFGVRLVEIVRPLAYPEDTGCYALERFKPAVLPKELTEALTATPADNLCGLIRKSRELEKA